jgi:hypothetical protein
MNRYRLLLLSFRKRASQDPQAGSPLSGKLKHNGGPTGILGGNKEKPATTHGFPLNAGVLLEIESSHDGC